ncbi:MAG: tRNA (adenosine(37)-N6)-threonylcarbamoyltransferase complex dimerization subunit type 1 TsaB [Candidatus Binatia bacterium]|nr:tRNA (adenosine(37)-N6)-threonylcarbamoyltransferase complex dimerization subunit type 1 TsaB [Candidatus Binatia bacterium]
MLILGIDTATTAASVALVRNGELVMMEPCPTASGHVETLLPLVAALCARVGECFTALDGIGVALGPGSFSGLRVGLSTVKGLAYVLGCPVAGIPTLDALAQTVTSWEGLICPLLDARNGEVYTAFFRRTATGRVEKLTPDLLLTPQTLCQQVTTPCLLVGDGILHYERTIQADCRVAVSLSPTCCMLSEVIARLAWERFLHGEKDDPSTLEPLYLRPPQARLPQPAGLGNLP